MNKSASSLMAFWNYNQMRQWLYIRDGKSYPIFFDHLFRILHRDLAAVFRTVEALEIIENTESGHTATPKSMNLSALECFGCEYDTNFW